MTEPDTSESAFRLRIDAHALVQLGEQLITDDEQALLELAKNSYDADAEYAKIRVITDYIPNANDPAPADAIGLIEIEDNGFGMDEKELRDGWLMISVSLKRDQKVILAFEALVYEEQCFLISRSMGGLPVRAPVGKTKGL